MANLDDSAGDDARSTGQPANRLAGELSPYLLLHRHNPVDWYPWGEEAIDRARAEDKPIFLSVGYATCFWCHVMERESFADPATADVMNEYFVNVKLDREERPDLDEIYITATQLLTGQGGWPNSVFLAPGNLAPFFAGTYFPPYARQNMPAFRDVLYGLADAWQSRRAEVEEQAEEVRVSVKRYLEERSEPAGLPSSEVATRALASLETRFDEDFGGFGGAPKFPSPANLYLLDALADDLGLDAPLRDRARGMLETTLDHMARGGIHDQIGGGFHRYAVDAAWRVPHFEKMLYDNGHLLTLFARAHARSGSAEHARIVRRTVDFLAREMRHEDGGFFSAIDAETDGFEGAFYVWTAAQLESALGAEDRAFLAPLLGFDGAPFFEREHYVLHRPETLAEQASRRRLDEAALVDAMAPLESRLLAARGERKRPLTDDKVLTDWNGMVISGLATAGRHLGDPDIVALAASAAGFVLDALVVDGELRHCWRDGQAKQPAMIGDYAFLIRGLLDLATVDDDGRWIESAVTLTAEQRSRLGDPEKGGFFTAAAADDILARSKEIFDGALPSANAIVAINLVDLATATGESRYRREAESVLRAFGHFADRQGDATRMLATAVHHFHFHGHGHGHARADAETGADLAVDAELTADDEESVQSFRLTIEVADGLHIEAETAPGALTAIDAEILDASWPAGRPVERVPGEDPVAVLDGRFEVRGRVRVTGKAPRLVLRAQPCGATGCRAPAAIEIALPR